MAVTLNAKGTSVPSFTIGKKGTTLHQGDSRSPVGVDAGDFWFDPTNGTLKVKSSTLAEWKNLAFDNITFSDNSILSLNNEATITLNDGITLSPGAGNDVTVLGEFIVESDSDISLLLNANVLPTETPIVDAGIFVYRGNQDTVGLVWDEGDDKWTVQTRSDVDPDTASGEGAGTVTSSYTLLHTGNVTPGLINQTIVAGSGLTGGGNDQTVNIDVGDGDGIDVSDDGIAVDSTVARVGMSIAQTFNGDIVIDGNLTVNGNTDVVQRDISTGENTILLNADWPTGTAPTENAGIFVYRGNTGEDTTGIAWDEANNKWTIRTRSGVDPSEPDFPNTGGGTVTTSFDLYHEGNKPTPAEIGAGSLSADNTWGGYNVFNNGEFQVGSSAGVYTKYRYDATLSSDGTNYRKIYHEGNKPTSVELGYGNLQADPTYGHAGSVSGYFKVEAGSQYVWFDSAGNIAINSPSDYKALYHEGNKPTPAEIGAASDSHTHPYLPLTGGTLSGELNLASGAGMGITWENGQHVMTNNDGGGNFNFRLSNVYSTTHVATVANCTPFHQVWSNDLNGTGTHSFNIGSGQDYMVNDPISWYAQIVYSKNYVRLSYSGSKKLETTSAGVTITGEVSATEFNTTSSVRYKENVQDLDYTVEFDKLRPVSYNRKDSGKAEIGFIAEEVNEIIPEVVQKVDDVVEGIDYSRLTAVLTAKVQQQDAKINELEEKLDEIMRLLQK